jgi:hypothetical protein
MVIFNGTPTHRVSLKIKLDSLNRKGSRLRWEVKREVLPSFVKCHFIKTCRKMAIWLHAFLILAVKSDEW